jgi:hypothetical protein
LRPLLLLGGSTISEGPHVVINAMMFECAILAFQRCTVGHMSLKFVLTVLLQCSQQA